MNHKNDLPLIASELVTYGCIVQDGDASVPGTERERRFNHYIEMVDSLTGQEGVLMARALLRSIQSIHDYGAYESTIGKLVFDFPPEDVAQAVVAEVPRLIDELPDWAGNVLNVLTQTGSISEALVAAFNRELACETSADQEKIRAFIRSQELHDGWLTDKPRILAP